MNYSIIVKEDCATCQLVVPVIKQLQTDDQLTIYSQDNVQFPAGVSVIDDTELEYSWRRRIETVQRSQEWLVGIKTNGRC